MWQAGRRASKMVCGLADYNQMPWAPSCVKTGVPNPLHCYMAIGSFGDGKRVRDPNSPLSADLSHQHRFGCAARKQSQKCSRAGRWGTGAPTSDGRSNVRECPLSEEERSFSQYRSTTHPATRLSSGAHPSAKSVKIPEQPDGPELSEDGPSVPDGEILRRQSTGSMSYVANKRFPLGQAKRLWCPVLKIHVTGAL